MRNLLGRLHARSPEELARIAAFWQVPLRSDDRAAQVGRLYRELTDPRSARTAWERLTGDERRCVRLLALGDESAIPLAEIAARLALPEPETRRIAIHLYQIGILARAGDDQPLPVGEVPLLFLPRELALLFRRIQDEIEAGDLSTTPLRALLELLDDAEIEEAGRIWGLTVIPGLRQRNDLTAQLLRQVANPGSLPTVVARLRGDAAKIWRCVRDAPGQAPVPLAAAAAAVNLAQDDARHAQRLRDALAEIETALLVWHTYHPDGTRWLFIPREIRAPRAAAPTGIAPPAPLAASPAAPPRRHPDAFAWDLLTVVRAVTQPDAPPWRAESALPRSWLRQVNRTLWHHGGELPPTGYLELLVTLAEHGSLVRRRADEDNAPLQLGPGVRPWRDLPFPAQTERLRQAWLQTLDWTETRAAANIQIWGADWRGFRRRLLALLGELPAATWLPLDDTAAWLAARAPDLLGDTFTVATAHPIETDPAATDRERRQAAMTEIMTLALTTALHWLGFVDLAASGNQPVAIQRVDAAEPAAAGASGPPLIVQPALAIELHQPTPLRVWSLSAFARVTRLDRVPRYELSPESVGRALQAGFDLSQITTFLTRQSGQELPAEAAVQLETWASGVQRVRLRPAFLLVADDAASAERLREIIAAAGGQARLLASGELLVEPAAPAASGQSPEERLAAQLRAHGFTPQWANPATACRRRQ